MANTFFLRIQIIVNNSIFSWLLMLSKEVELPCKIIQTQKSNVLFKDFSPQKIFADSGMCYVCELSSQNAEKNVRSLWAGLIIKYTL